MKVLKATLAFVMGLVLGIILLVLAIGGTVVALGTTRTVGELQSAVTDQEIISSDSELYGQTVLEAVQKALNDYQNFDEISLKLLYERYGIKLLNGISGLDFTKKSFYGTPLTDIINDMSLLLDDIYLSDIDAIAHLDLVNYNIPLINENMDVGLSKALENMMNLVNGDLSIRLLKNKLNLDIGADDNTILSALQDVNLKNIGSLIDVLPLGTLLDAKTDIFLPKGTMQVYLSTEGTAEEWEEVSKDDLTNPDYAPALGIETYIAGGTGGENNKLVEKELRYIKKGDDEPYADNSCYNEGWTCPEGAKVLRHRLYKAFDGDGTASGKYFVIGYGNHLESFDNAKNAYTLTVKDFLSLDDIFVSATGAKISKTLVKGGKLDLTNTKIYYFQKADEGDKGAYVESGEYSILDKTMEKNNILRLPDEAPKDENGDPVLDEDGNVVGPKHPYIAGRARYWRAQAGEASPLLQYLNFLTVGDVRSDTDSILKNVRIGDIIDTDAPGTADILKALKDSTLDSIGSDINTIPFGMMFGDSENQLLNAIKDFTLETIDEDINTLKIGDIIDTEGNTLLEALKDSTLNSISDDIKELKLAQVMEINDDSPQILRALASHDATLTNIDTIIETLTVGELLEVDFDEYEEWTTAPQPDETYYVKVPAYAPISEELLLPENEKYLKEVYGEDMKRGTYNEETKEFTPDPDGDHVEIFYYALYDEEVYGTDQTLYTLVHEGETALAVQSLSRRGVPALEMGNYINELSIGELMRIEPNSSQLFLTLARRGSTLDSISKEVDDLEIADMIKIDETSSKIMQSLKARHCKIGDMANITDELTLSEILNIVPDTYAKNTESGKYVCVFDKNGYVPYDPIEHAGLDRFEKVDDEYVPYDGEDKEGLFVHSSYYTLYNPAVHFKGSEEFEFEMDGDEIARFDKIPYDAEQDPTGENAPSSKILQRFAGSTMGEFSDSFNDIMLSDVMDIDPDIYAAVGIEEIDAELEAGETLFKYVKEQSVYSVAKDEDIAAAKEGEVTLYKVVHTGDSTSILKKLAYVKVNDMADALDTVMKDMMLSEIIDIHEFDAINSEGFRDFDPESDDASTLTGSNFFIPWDGDSMVNGRPIVFVYEETGKYIARDYYYRPINETSASETARYLGEAETIYYEYKQLTPAELATQKENLLAKGNVYVKREKVVGEEITYEYVHNIALATYCIVNMDKGLLGNVYYRETSTAPTEYSGKVYKNADTSKVFVDALSGRTAYDPNDPAHCDIPKYYKLEEAGKTYIVPLDKAGVDDGGYDYKVGQDVRFGTQYARDVMIQYPTYEAAKAAADANDYGEAVEDHGYNEVYVFLPSTNSYTEYKEGEHDEEEAYYVKQIGYVAQFGEVFYSGSEGYRTSLKFKIAPDVLREHSSKVLSLLADKTINEMNSAIEGATIDDFMDVTPGTIFDDEAIRESTLNKLGTTLASELSTMTIGKLIEWGSITTIEPAVLTALNAVTLTDFFGALTYNATNGEITFDMVKMYGLKTSVVAP